MRKINLQQFFFFSSRRRHTRLQGDWSSDVCSSDLGIFCIITTLEFLQHQFSQMGHREPSYDPHLHHNHRPTNAPLPHAKRPPPGGYVLTRLPEKSVRHREVPTKSNKPGRRMPPSGLRVSGLAYSR